MHEADEHITPELLEQQFSLSTAATRLDFLSRRDDGSTTPPAPAEKGDDDWLGFAAGTTSLDVHESLELLALGEVVARKAHDSRIIGIRAALRGGAGWTDIATALGGTPEEAWDDFTRSVGEELDPDAAAAARELAGPPPGPGAELSDPRPAPAAPPPPDPAPAASSARATRGWRRSSG
jgi:hypothetical protein